jgi:peptidoglycan/xylan/chitin deacetylase (PgdA/CDA1 family)
MDPKSLIGPRGKIPILVRDDDTSYFTSEKMLESVYSEAWAQGYKVSLSVVPFQKGIDDISVPPASRTSNSCYSIADNESLIKYIKTKIDQNVVEVIQHGLSHEMVDDIRGEFGSNLVKREEIEKGRNIIRQAFGMQPKFFVPPGEDVSNQNIIALLEQGLTPIYRDTVFDQILRLGFLPNLFKTAGMRLVMNRYNDETDENFGVQFIKPVLIFPKKNVITWSLPKIRASHITSFESLFNLTNSIITMCTQYRIPVCIINHYHLYYYDWSSTITKGELFGAWRNILRLFDKVEVGWKTTFLELHNRLEKIRGISIVKSGSKITIRADSYINDFSFQTAKPLEANPKVGTNEEMNIVTLDEVSPNTDLVFYEKD